jgi:hypothetical protein
MATTEKENNRIFQPKCLINGFITILRRRVPLVEQELLILPEHMSSPPVFSRVRVTREFANRRTENTKAERKRTKG